MIINNRIMFGYGDVLVGFDIYGRLNFTEFSPPTLIGAKMKITDETEIGDSINICVCIDELFILRNWLESLKKNGKISKEFNFKSYILDFTNYNEKSIDVVLGTVNRLLAFNLMPLAC